MIGNVLALALVNACFLAAGLGVTRAARLWSSGRGAVSWLPVSYVCGVAAVGIATEFALIAGLSLSRWQIITGCALLASLGLVWRAPFRENLNERGTSLTAWPIKVALAISLVLLVGESVFQALDTWDAFAMWTLKARALVLLNGLSPDVFANALYPHIDYPLLLPGLQAIDFRAMGDIDTRVIHVQSALLLVGWLLASARLLRGRADAWIVWAALGLATMAPATYTLIQEGYADIPAALFIALAALSAWRYLEQPQAAWAVLVAVFATAGAETKREGWTFALGLFLVALAYAAKNKRPVRPLLAGLALCLVTVGAWLAWLAHYGITGHDDVPVSRSLDPRFLVSRVDRAGKAVVSLADYSPRPYLWLVILPMTLLVALLALRDSKRRTVASFVLVTLAVEYCALVWAFWISRAPIHWHLEHAAPRVVATPAFVAAAFLPLLVGRGKPVAGNNQQSRSGSGEDRREIDTRALARDEDRAVLAIGTGAAASGRRRVVPTTTHGRSALGGGGGGI